MSQSNDLESPKAPAEALRQQIIEVLMVKAVRPLGRRKEDDIDGWNKWESQLAHARWDTDKIIKLVTAYAATAEREGRADEVHRYIDRSDSLSEEKYAFRRLAALQGPIQGDSK